MAYDPGREGFKARLSDHVARVTEDVAIRQLRSGTWTAVACDVNQSAIDPHHIEANDWTRAAADMWIKFGRYSPNPSPNLPNLGAPIYVKKVRALGERKGAGGRKTLKDDWPQAAAELAAHFAVRPNITSMALGKVAKKWFDERDINCDDREAEKFAAAFYESVTAKLGAREAATNKVLKRAGSG